MAQFPRWRIALVLGCGVLAAASALVLAPAARAASTLTATFVVADSWSTGYRGEYTIRNSGTTAVTGWRVEFDLPADTTVKNYWTASLVRTGTHYAFSALSYNATVPAGGTQGFGFNAIGLGKPSNCTVNGAPCSGGTPPPSASRSATPTGPAPTTPGPTPTSPGPTPTSPSPNPTGRTVNVATAAQLSAALAGALPGDTIRLASGSYDGTFYALHSGTASTPITLTGPRTAVLSNSGGGCDPNVPASGLVSYCGYGLHLNGASYWRLVGFAVTNSAKGIVLDSASHNVIDGVEVSNTDLEGVHLRTASSDNVFQNSYVHDTGRTDPGFGEGLYFGSAQGNWDKFGENGGTGPDRSDRNQALNNQFGPGIGGEHIDIKEGTVGGLIKGNNFDGRGISGQHFADSWVDVKGSGYTLDGNVGTFVAGTGTLADGYQVHQIVAGSGCGNVWRNNNSDLGGVGAYAINVTDQANCTGNLNVVYSSNTVTNATKGLTNIAVTAG
jgi:parallel beta-helix repeat protein